MASDISYEKEKLLSPSIETGKDLEIGQEPYLSSAPPSHQKPSTYLYLWIVLNILATVSIVPVNKSILSNSPFSGCQLSFVAYHFTITGFILSFAGRFAIAKFNPIEPPILSILPLSLVMCANVVLMNLSLAYSSIVSYQIIRILLVPLTALINFVFYGSKLPLNATLALIPACAGVGLVSVSNLQSKQPDDLSTLSPSTESSSYLGIIFALSGVVCSSLYTVWVAHYHSSLQISSMQLLYKQVPPSALLLGFLSIFTDKFPIWSTVTTHQWGLLLLSGGCACLINLTSVFVIRQAGPVSSAVVGHLKTCLIVGIGWLGSPNDVRNESILGVLLAMLGIILYSNAIQHKVSR